MADVLYVVVPCFNEAEVLPETAKRLGGKLRSLIVDGRVDAGSRILFINDGSNDGTWELIEALHRGDRLFSGLDLSRNRGHQNALLAGLMTAKDRADLTISIDADLQDDPETMDGMLEKYREGCEIVYGVRSSRTGDSAFKRRTALCYYRLLKRLGADLVYNHADYRLLSRRALEALSEFEEVNLFLRGLVPMLGFRSDVVFYDRTRRFAGQSKYSLRKMLHFAWEGLSSLSAAPIHLITRLGLILLPLCLILALVFGIRALGGSAAPAGFWTILSVWSACGLLLTAVGVVGEYVAKVYWEAKGRPRYLIRKLLDVAEDADGGEKL